MESYTSLLDTSSSLFAAVLWEGHRDELLAAGDELDGLVRNLALECARRSLALLLQRWSMFFEETTDDRVAQRVDGVFTSVLGPVEVSLPRLRTRGTREQHSPMAEVFGVRASGKSPRVERALVDFGSEQSYGRAASRFAEHYGFDIGRTSLLRVVQRHGERAEQYLADRFATPVAASDDAHTVFVQLDGSMVPTGEFKSAGYAGRTDLPRGAQVRPREWREVRVGLALRDGAVDATYVARMASYDVVTDQLHGAAVMQGLGPTTDVVCTADGGNGLKTAVLDTFDNCAFVLDHAHLVQHLWELANERDKSTAQSWVDETLAELAAGRSRDVLKRLRKELLRIRTDHPRSPDPAPALRRFIDYLDEHADSVAYDRYREAGWLIGSGRCESAHRYIPQARLKIPGATWSPANVNRMLAIRVIRANGWWDDFWGQAHGPRLAV